MPGEGDNEGFSASSFNEEDKLALASSTEANVLTLSSDRGGFVGFSSRVAGLGNKSVSLEIYKSDDGISLDY